MQDRSHLATEQRLAESERLDQLSVAEAVALMNAQDALAVAAVGREREAIARAVEVVAERLGRGGRLVYFGAGTSGRLGVLDASECPPTFRTDPQQVQGVIAGGEGAMFRSVEGAEDDADAGAAAVAERRLGERDVVFGIAAGGTTPFVRGALQAGRAAGAATIFLTCAQRTEQEAAADVVIRPIVGPEVLTGSTRLKAGTATKLVLNTVTTLAMVQLGKVYGNLMVDLRASNSKLWDRGARVVSALTGLDREQAMQLLREANGHVKAAVVMQRCGVGLEQADALLAEHHGMLRALVR